MRHRLKAMWPVVKAVLGLAILVLIGRQFARDLQRPDLWQRPLHAGWLILAGGLYLAGLGCSAWFWLRLLRRLGERPTTLTVLRAYFIGNLGKYMPGKAWALLMRAGLAQAGGVRFGVAVLTIFYEVITAMASGALLATVLFAFLAPSSGATLDWEALMKLVRLEAPGAGVLERSAVVPLAGLMLAVTLIPLWPAVFNRLVLRLPGGQEATAKMEAADLFKGLALTTFGWLLHGASLVAVLHGILGDSLNWTPGGFGLLCAGLALACVAGFLILLVPAGLGVREFFLTLLLAPELENLAGLEPAAARATAVLAVLVLRLVWTVAELLLAGCLFLTKGRLAPRSPAGGAP
jgi:glycosyltransferase 2 family protein